MKIVVEYPTPGEEVEIVQRMGVSPPQPHETLSIESLAELQRTAEGIFVAREVIDYAVSLVFATREPERFGLADLRELVTYGASPRASLGLIAAGRALALLRGRSYVLPQDVFDVAPDILRHRLVLSYEALARDLGVDDVLGRLLSTVPAPRVAPSQDPSAHSSHTGYGSAPTGSGGWGASGHVPGPAAPASASNWTPGPRPASAGPWAGPAVEQAHTGTDGTWSPPPAHPGPGS
jgi:MoxR-like ATPase